MKKARAERIARRSKQKRVEYGPPRKKRVRKKHPVYDKAEHRREIEAALIEHRAKSGEVQTLEPGPEPPGQHVGFTRGRTARRRQKWRSSVPRSRRFDPTKGQG